MDMRFLDIGKMQADIKMKLIKSGLSEAVSFNVAGDIVDMFLNSELANSEHVEFYKEMETDNARLKALKTDD